MSVLADLRMLYQLSLAPVRGRTHRERLESFYGGQAAGYDAFRARLLSGRESLIQKLPISGAAVWIDLGGGTGSNLEAAGDRVSRCRQIYIVDLAPSLLRVARDRIVRRRWSNVQPVLADATEFRPPHPANLVTFSYSLTMIPDWFSALEQAWNALAPGGCIGVVDFFVSRKHPTPGAVRHSWFTRHIIPAWFGFDNVFLNADLAPYLQKRFEPVHYSEHRAGIPWLPLVRVPYFQFIGRKPR